MRHLKCGDCNPNEEEDIVGHETHVMILHRPECKHVPEEVKVKYAELAADDALKKFEKPVGD